MVFISFIWGYNISGDLLNAIEIDKQDVKKTFGISSDESLQIRVAIFMFLYGTFSILA